MDIKIFMDIPPWEWPKNADRLFLEVLKDPEADEEERLIAAELAGDYTVICDELAEMLINLVASDRESDEMRGTAVIALGPALENADLMEFNDEDEILISEGMFERIKDTLQKLYFDAGVHEYVRRRILEASVRAPQNWHVDAVRAAYAAPGEDWKLTAVFCMGYVRGFEEQILESLGSTNPDIEYHAVQAAGNWEIDAAWPKIEALLVSEDTDKFLLLAAIEAAANVRPEEAQFILLELSHSEDEDIAETALEAIAMMRGAFDDDDYLDDDDLI